MQLTIDGRGASYCILNRQADMSLYTGFEIFHIYLPVSLQNYSTHRGLIPLGDARTGEKLRTDIHTGASTRNT
jgi:hypothetical protein